MNCTCATESCNLVVFEKIYSRSLTANYIRNNVITLTKLFPLSLRSTWFNYTCWLRKSLFLSKYGKKSLIISVDMIFEIVHDVSSCSCKWVSVWASLPRITTGQWSVLVLLREQWFMGWTSLSTGPKANLNFLNLRTIFFMKKTNSILCLMSVYVKK